MKMEIAIYISMLTLDPSRSIRASVYTFYACALPMATLNSCKMEKDRMQRNEQAKTRRAAQAEQLRVKRNEQDRARYNVRIEE